ncbi:MAG TPA: ADP/ATP-dependent (S)-NAD(P)H-hydrate dehydratase [Candidatus Lumbricidophila sp.]|nr:ADP/ATP-dependent (S)-NAD(P)H-hydrate dehydratase [Candidatus Lumbricidophila sp.]
MDAPKEWTAVDAAAWVRAPMSDDDKYRRGVLGVVTGSSRYPGAAVLGVEAAVRTGVGMVRYLGEATGQVLARRPEAVTVPGRVQAWLLGSGMDAASRTPALAAQLAEVLAEGLPTVLDAGALVLAPATTGLAILTPHARELAVLFEATGVTPVPDDPAARAAHAAEAYGAAVLLKGAVTHIAAPGGAAYTVTAPTHWLATAGTGDVLGGILGAVLATNHDRLGEPAALAAIAATAAYLHGHAALAASAAAGGGPVPALRIAKAVAPEVGRLLG